MPLYPRLVEQRIADAMLDTRVVRTRSGWPILPTYGRLRAGSMCSSFGQLFYNR